eukprot:5559032-Prymnesium_polylepis.1
MVDATELATAHSISHQPSINPSAINQQSISHQSAIMINQPINQPISHQSISQHSISNQPS